MTIATDFQELARDLVGEFASEATLRRVTQSEGSYDPVEGGYTGGGETVTNEPVHITPPKAFSEMLIDGTLVQQDDFTVFIADLPFVPDVADGNTTDTLIYNGTEYSIVRVMPKSLPDNAVAGYTLHCRG